MRRNRLVVGLCASTDSIAGFKGWVSGKGKGGEVEEGRREGGCAAQFLKQRGCTRDHWQFVSCRLFTWNILSFRESTRVRSAKRLLLFIDVINQVCDALTSLPIKDS